MQRSSRVRLLLVIDGDLFAHRSYHALPKAILRRGRKPAGAILGQKGDPTNDPTLRWDDEDNRATTPLGKIAINAIAPDATCNAFSFLPANVPDGIAGPAYQTPSSRRVRRPTSSR